ncbi:MAG: hypothetical protein J6S76_00620, partial [Clostridia bacterium]|nr:hypothetical protein [Clostridia bacterium]
TAEIVSINAEIDAIKAAAEAAKAQAQAEKAQAEQPAPEADKENAPEDATAPASVVCPACGTELPGGAVFCCKCGQKQE